MATQSMGELVDDLVHKSYIERRADPADRRAKRIYLTAKGRAHADASWVAVDKAESHIRELLGQQRYNIRTDLTEVAGLQLDLRSSAP